MAQCKRKSMLHIYVHGPAWIMHGRSFGATINPANGKDVCAECRRKDRSREREEKVKGYLSNKALNASILAASAACCF